MFTLGHIRRHSAIFINRIESSHFFLGTTHTRVTHMVWCLMKVKANVTLTLPAVIAYADYIYGAIITMRHRQSSVEGFSRAETD